jgi:hypothetical protein
MPTAKQACKFIRDLTAVLFECRILRGAAIFAYFAKGAVFELSFHGRVPPRSVSPSGANTRSLF